MKRPVVEYQGDAPLSEVVDPTGGRRRVGRGVALPSVFGLGGQRVGILDNGKTNADIILGEVGSAISAQLAGVGVVNARKNM